MIQRQKYIRCPKCSEAAVDINSSDFFECRNCHTQYSTSNLGGKDEGTNHLVIDQDAPLVEGVRKVRILVTKGEGKFPLDDAIKEFRARLNTETAKE